MSYTFVSETTDSQFYKIKLVLYKDTRSTNPFEDSIVLGVHKNNSLRSKVSAVKAYVVNKKIVSDTIRGYNCAIPSNFLREQVEYEALIAVPYLADSGYIVTWPRCCRIQGGVNVADGAGMMSAAFIAPGKFRNSSAHFKVNPFMFLCPGKVAEITYEVEDKDGDSLVYALVQPYTGGSNFNPLPYSNELDVPGNLPAFSKISYNFGFSETKPFGPGGMAQMDLFAPKSYLRAQFAGLYSLAVEVKEYRQGILLSTGRYDFITSVPISACNNSVPNINLTTGDSVNLIFWAGKSKCFQMTVSDVKDSVFLSSRGDLLDGTGGYNGTRATLPDASGFKSAQSQLCWIPPASAVRTQPYLVEVVVKDNGCPAAIRYIKYFITVAGTGLTSAPGLELPDDRKPVLFPNPVSDKLTIHFAEPENAAARIQIFNLHGQKVFESEGNPGEVEFELNISGLPAGVYLLCTERNNERLYSKFLKQEIR